MLKKVSVFVAAVIICLMCAGCSLMSVDRTRAKANRIADDLFSQATVTMPVLVTNTPIPTFTPIPSDTPRPTETETPTPTYQIIEYSSPTFEVLSTAEMPLSAKDQFTNVSDVTVPDDTVLEPGQLFIKSWRMTNSGESIWTEETKLMMEANYDMDMPDVVKAIFIKPNDWIDFTPGGWGTRIFNVGPGTETDLAVILKAPETPGSYQIHFRLVNPSGEIIPTQFWMRFAVSRPTATPTPTPTSETPQPEPIPYDWDGRWMVREPFHAEGIIPVNAWINQNEDEVLGFIYDSKGDPIIIKGALTDTGRVFNGEIYYPWNKQTTAVSWRMQISRNQFHAITPLGVLNESAVCGARDGNNLPESCALPSEG